MQILVLQKYIFVLIFFEGNQLKLLYLKYISDFSCNRFIVRNNGCRTVSTFAATKNTSTWFIHRWLCHSLLKRYATIQIMFSVKSYRWIIMKCVKHLPVSLKMKISHWNSFERTLGKSFFRFEDIPICRTYPCSYKCIWFLWFFFNIVIFQFK